MKRKYAFGIVCLMLLTGFSACGETVDALPETDTAPTEISIPSTEETVETQQEVLDNQIPDNYAAAIVVTINPQVKLYLDTDNVIVGVEYLNEDARTAFSEITLSGTTVEEGMGRIVEAAIEKEFLTDGKDVNIEVAEIKDDSFDSAGVCAVAENAVVISLEDNEVEAHVSVEVADSIMTDSVMVESTETETEEPELEAGDSKEPLTESVQAVCATCGGTGKCDECKGDGYRGSGYIVSCPRCHGSLTETCIYCDANGNSNKHEGTCDFPNCMGAHVYACTICGGGSTPVTCRSCNGSGNCKSCGGSGTQ